MKVTVFYSWQSDLPNNTNRSFVQRALEKAIESLKTEEELVIEPCLERDTVGVSGSPDIASTIFRKIDDCHIFVGDVSIINPKTRSGRKTSNPNVLLELGYAAKKLTWDNVICVFNSVYGRTEDLPFDLRLRRMALYSVTEEQESKAEERDRLTLVLRAALLSILIRLNQQVQEETAPKPLTPDQASAKTKEFMADDRYRIQLSELVVSQGNELAQRIAGPEFPVQVSRLTGDNLKDRVQRYQAISQVALAIMVAGCYFGTKAHVKLWADFLQRVANPQAEWAGTVLLLNLRRYPSLLMMYGGGMAAVAGENYETMLALLTRPNLRDHRHARQDLPAYYALSPHRIMEKDDANMMLARNCYAPMSEHFFTALREPFRFLLPEDREYQRCFDRFEYMRALVDVDMAGDPQYVGCFGWRWKYPEWDVMKDIEAEEGQLGRHWPPYQAGWFQGQRERFMAAKKKVSEVVAHLGWH